MDKRQKLERKHLCSIVGATLVVAILLVATPSSPNSASSAEVDGTGVAATNPFADQKLIVGFDYI